MDQLHQELAEPYPEDEDGEDEKELKEDDQTDVQETEDNLESLSEMDRGGDSRSSSEVGDEYETADSDQSVTDMAVTRKRKMVDTEQPDRDSGLGSMKSHPDTEAGSRSGDRGRQGAESKQNLSLIHI